MPPPPLSTNSKTQDTITTTTPPVRENQKSHRLEGREVVKEEAFDKNEPTFSKNVVEVGMRADNKGGRGAIETFSCEEQARQQSRPGSEEPKAASPVVAKPAVTVNASKEIDTTATIQSFYMSLEQARQQLDELTEMLNRDPCSENPLDPYPLFSFIQQAQPMLGAVLDLDGGILDEDEALISNNCCEKGAEIVKVALELVCGANKVTMDKNFEAGAAQLIEMYCSIPSEGTFSPSSIEIYSNFLLRCVQDRSKGSLKALTAVRTRMKMNARSRVDSLDAEEGEDASQTHINTIATILGESSTILGAIRSWRDGIERAPTWDVARGRLLECCTEAFRKVDLEAQTLAATVCKWMVADLGVSAWVERAGRNEGGEDLGELDSLLEEVAFLCQVVCRYLRFIEDDEDGKSALGSLSKEHYKLYTTLECFHVKFSLGVALGLATPYNIVDNVYSPSYVEDAFYVCRKALERCCSTTCQEVVIDVGRFIKGLYDGGGVVRVALERGDGCKKSAKGAGGGAGGGQDTPKKKKKDKTEGANGDQGGGRGWGLGMFAAALMDAVDDMDEEGAVPGGGGVVGVAENWLQSDEDKHFAKVVKIMGIAGCRVGILGLVGVLQDNEFEGDLVEGLKAVGDDYMQWMVEECEKIVKGGLGGVDGEGVGEFELRENDSLVFLRMRKYVGGIDYDLEEKDFDILENERRIEKALLEGLRGSLLMKAIEGGAFGDCGAYDVDSEGPLHCLMKKIGERAGDCLFKAILDVNEGGIGDWGALLLSKYVRCVEKVLGVGPGLGILVSREFDKVQEAINLLSVEKIGDLERWYDEGGGLGEEEREAVIRRRKDFC
ncbi:hypothetical protein TrCOL_g7755 [Triparma columacea]|uniref:Uncharacterized protein n=1 Tax=Triparma columacea TaxID=722753 RepID=A0A9W7GQY3_9STRA|nr:hypothetical protein TrCOL_g7755 [Triparma columacea]